MTDLVAALDRQTGVLMALAALAVAAAIVSWGAWALLRRERGPRDEPDTRT